MVIKASEKNILPGLEVGRALAFSPFAIALKASDNCLVF